MIPLGRPDVLRIAASGSGPRHQQQGSSSPAMPLIAFGAAKCQCWNEERKKLESVNLKLSIFMEN